MTISDILNSFGNWSVILTRIIQGDLLTTILSLLTLSLTVGSVIYFFSRA